MAEWWSTLVVPLAGLVGICLLLSPPARTRSGRIAPAPPVIGPEDRAAARYPAS